MVMTRAWLHPKIRYCKFMKRGKQTNRKPDAYESQVTGVSIGLLSTIHEFTIPVFLVQPGRGLKLGLEFADIFFKNKSIAFNIESRFSCSKFSD